MDPQDEELPEEQWVKVGHYPNLREAYDHGLVILAMGEACRVEEAEAPGEYDLQTEVHPAPRVLEELDAYGRELPVAPAHVPVPVDWRRHPSGWWWSLT